jgi:NAD(P)-dependent dehydrogenase (short-subunit alcohol dehydrogenase family)
MTSNSTLIADCPSRIFSNQYYRRGKTMILSDNVLVITGAARGIGQAIALRAASEGAAVVCADIGDYQGTVDQITSKGGQAIGVHTDVREATDWSRLIDRAQAEYGKVDLLGNIAGIVNEAGPDTVVELSEENWATVIATDLTGVWLGMRATIPAMIAVADAVCLDVAELSLDARSDL